MTSDHGFIELLSPDAILVTQTEAARADRTLQEDVRFRYVTGFHPDGAGDAVEVPGSPDAYCVAVGRRWFRREGSRNAPRYEHGGLSLAEMVIPGAVLKRVTEKEARAAIVRLPAGVLVVEEDEQTELSFAIEKALSTLLRSDKILNPLCNSFPTVEVPETVNQAIARFADPRMHASRHRQA